MILLSPSLIKIYLQLLILYKHPFYIFIFFISIAIIIHQKSKNIDFFIYDILKLKRKKREYTIHTQETRKDGRIYKDH